MAEPEGGCEITPMPSLLAEPSRPRDIRRFLGSMVRSVFGGSGGLVGLDGCYDASITLGSPVWVAEVEMEGSPASQRAKKQRETF